MSIHWCAFLAMILGMPTGIQPDMILPCEAEVLAQMIQGEGVHLMGGNEQVAGIVLVHTLLNGRAEGDTIRETAEKRFHGYSPDIVPTSRNILLAQWAAAIYPYKDISNGSVYVLSLTDLTNHGALSKAVEAQIAFRDGIWGLYFFRAWPLGEGK